MNFERERLPELAMRRYVPCPHCLTMQIFGAKCKEQKGHQVIYRCPHCQKVIEERHKNWMDDNGAWVPDGTPAWQRKELERRKSFPATGSKEARRIARKMLAPALPVWGNEQRVKVHRRPDGGVTVSRAGKPILWIGADSLPNTAPQDLYRIIAALIDLVEEQAAIVQRLLPFATFDVATTRKRERGLDKAHSRTRKATRAEVEKLMLNCIRLGVHWTEQGLDPSAFGYRDRQFRNIWNEQVEKHRDIWDKALAKRSR